MNQPQKKDWSVFLPVATALIAGMAIGEVAGYVRIQQINAETREVVRQEMARQFELRGKQHGEILGR